MSKTNRNLSPWIAGLFSIALAVVVVVSHLASSAQASESLAQTLTAEVADGTHVSVRYEKGVLPEGAGVEATLVHRPEVIDAVSKAIEVDGGKAASVKAIDVTLRDAAGEEIQPKGSVMVTFSKTGLSSDEIAVYHVADESEGDDALGSQESASEDGQRGATETGVASEQKDASESHPALKVEEVKTIKAESDEQIFEASHFSIYAIVDTGNKARMELRFHRANSDGYVSVLVKKGDSLDEAVYDPGVGTLENGQSFRGWTTVADYDSNTQPQTIGDIRSLVESKLPAVNDLQVLDLYPIVLNALNVSYVDEHGSSLGSETIYLDRGASSVEYTVNMNYTPSTSSQSFEGWKVQSGAGGIAGYDEDAVYPNGTKLQISKSVIFSVTAPEGHWLVFNENGKNATYVAPQFVKGGSLAVAPDIEPQRSGYDFDGWYTASEGGSKFGFDIELTDNTNVYAHWTKKSHANYTVLIWKQNVKGDGYDFSESISIEDAPTGEVSNAVQEHGYGNGAYVTVAGEEKQYTGFHLGRYDRGVVVKPEGNTIVNVYYDRKEIKLTFATRYTPTTSDYGTQYGFVSGAFVPLHRGYDGWYYRAWSYNYSYYRPYGGTRYTKSNDWQLYRQMTGLYGSTLESNGFTWPDDYWWYSQHSYDDTSGAGVRFTFMEAFLPPTGDSMTLYGFPGSGDHHVYFYKQDSDGEHYSATNDVTTTGGTFYISDKYNGYRPVAYSTNGYDWTSLRDRVKDPSTGYYGQVSNWSTLHIRYAPERYNLLYEDGIYVDGNGNPVEGFEGGAKLDEVDGIAYGSDMSSYNKGGADYEAHKPSHDGFVFGGWYLDDQCTRPYTFTTMTEGITVYAKWVQNQYRVFMHAEAGNDPTLDWGSSAQPMTQLVSSGNKVSLPTGLRDGYQFVGWYLDKGYHQPFSAKAFVFNDTNVTTPYDKTVDLTDELDKFGNLVNEATAYNQDDEAHENRFWVSRKVDLYAKWRAVLTGARGINVQYDANGGTDAPHDTMLYLDNTTAVAGAASTAPQGKQFAYWVVQTWDSGAGMFKDADLHVFPGDTFTVLKSNAHDVDNGDGTHEYTVKLRAEYLSKGSPIDVVWAFDANGGQFSDDVTEVKGRVPINEKIPVPSAPSRFGYSFAGWGTAANALGPAVASDPMLASARGYAADNLDGTAWDASRQANVLYALWTPLPVELSVRKEILGTEANLQEKFNFTVSYADDTGKVYTGSATLGDKTLAGTDGDTAVFTSLTAVDGSTHLLAYGDEVSVVEQEPGSGYITKHQVLNNPEAQGLEARNLRLGNSGTEKNVKQIQKEDGSMAYVSGVVFTNDRISTPTTGVVMGRSGGVLASLVVSAGVLLGILGVIVTRRHGRG